MNALIFDLDGVGIGELRNPFHLTEIRSVFATAYADLPCVVRERSAPVLCVQGADRSIISNIKVQLKSLKYDLTFRIWEYKGTSQLKAIQYQSINQGFRRDGGSINAKYGTELKAFHRGACDAGLSERLRKSSRRTAVL